MEIRSCYAISEAQNVEQKQKVEREKRLERERTLISAAAIISVKIGKIKENMNILISFIL